MALCDVCGNFDDFYLECGEQKNMKDDPDYQPDLYYYWDSPIEEDYDWRGHFPKVDCMCEVCFDIANKEKENHLGTIRTVYQSVTQPLAKILSLPL